MEIKELKERPNIDQNIKLSSAYSQLSILLNELRKKDLPDEVLISINQGIDKINTVSESEKGFRKQLRKTQTDILKLIEKKLKLVTKNHHRNTWLVLGMAVFGVPFGVALGTSLENMGLLGIGLPFGMLIGVVLGLAMDKKALKDGRQLDLEIKH